ncbi:D-alanyl-D-alanine endopeptidase (penicillin-binding protein 7) [Andreprevotia lacus DSM 23236]|jgi:D-alanyl-D-alanine endopeptidase (penicillin-binding protein 7)|uniref:D-alanyl-D-alanine endopeptidase (Penicillin-binding protein 7) n=1 Tax=Andreprevotia lacus DSM 23236 TaxID=1121001 RepID=A0A1W1XGS5_9NEIS|nr:D-alanyl-D-alanine endopeptidase [Andreprevotia lacus]SMC23150.1 D-alanyl-D-alanine endopeptidase (penicillin-binding protein 7) [Andreprevotia lacus DSM 23236]
MRRPTLIICTLTAAVSLLLSPLSVAAGKSHPATSKKTAAVHSSKAGKQVAKSTAHGKKLAAKPRGVVTRSAIANARHSVHVAKASTLPSTLDNPGVQSSGVLVLNETSGEVIYEKNADNVTPIASITKLMTAMVTLDAHLPMNQLITIEDDDTDTLKGTSSRLTVGTTLTRAEVLLLALMSSENRAAAALSRTYPGGRELFIRKMNEKAGQLGMRNTRFYDSTGLTPNNVSTPRDLALMVKAAHTYAEIHHFTTSSEYTFISSATGRELTFRNTNPLVKDDDWQIGVSKTGFINEAGRCLVMQATIDDTPVVMILLDSNGKYTRIGDATRVRKWLESSPVAKLKAG